MKFLISTKIGVICDSMSLYTRGETRINNMSKEGSTRQPLKALDKYKAWHKEGSDFRETMEVKEVGEFSKM